MGERWNLRLNMVLISPLSQTPQARRQEYVNTFNKSSQRGGCKSLELLFSPQTDKLVIFLLSSKAGKCRPLLSEWLICGLILHV